MSNDTLNKIVKDLSKLSVSEAAELSKLLEEKWGVEANAPVVATSAAPTAGAEAGDGEGEDDGGGVVNIELVAAPKNYAEKKDVKKVNTSFFSKKIPRNSLCPCGSGKKYKHCHGA